MTVEYLLFGVLALRHSFVYRDDLVAALAVWVGDKFKSIPTLLEDRGVLDKARRALLVGMYADHLRQHGPDCVVSPTAGRSLGAELDDLGTLDDAELQASLLAAASQPAAESIVVTLKVTAGPHRGRTFRFTEHDTFIVGRLAMLTSGWSLGINTSPEHTS